jgi:hypothetical protein
MSSIEPSLESTLQRLRELRGLLLHLHKALLESERVEYEQSYGQIQSKGEYFQLVVGHEWFSWLRPISQFIVQIDEMLSSKTPVALSEASQLLEKAQHLLAPVESGTPAEQRYYQAIQRDPEIASMHGQVTQLLATAR